MSVLTLLGPQSRFGDKLLIIRVLCPHIWVCGAKGAINGKTPRASCMYVRSDIFFCVFFFSLCSGGLVKMKLELTTSPPSEYVPCVSLSRSCWHSRRTGCCSYNGRMSMLTRPKVLLLVPPPPPAIYTQVGLASVGDDAVNHASHCVSYYCRQPGYRCCLCCCCCCCCCCFLAVTLDHFSAGRTFTPHNWE